MFSPNHLFLLYHVKKILFLMRFYSFGEENDYFFKMV